MLALSIRSDKRVVSMEHCLSITQIIDDNGTHIIVDVSRIQFDMIGDMIKEDLDGNIK